MKPPKHIEYVDLPSNAATASETSFFMRRFVHATFAPDAHDAPHRHNYQEILIVQAGHGQHTIDGQAIKLLPGTISLIGKGQVHRLTHLLDVSGWLIRFNDDFVPAGSISPAWKHQTSLFHQLGSVQALLVQPAELHELGRILELLEAEYTHPTALYQQDTLRHWLAIVLLHIQRLHHQARGATQPQREAQRVYHQFTLLLDHEFMRHHDVEFYATALHLAPVKLSKLLTQAVGKTTKHLIDERIVLEAKRYLHYTDLSIKEITFALGYTDLFHFSKLFKRVTGSAPQPFREQREKMT